jgi:hypothetical protein
MSRVVDTADALRILQLHNHHANLGGAMEVLSHERDLLVAAGHRVEQFTLPPTGELGLAALQAGAKAVWNREAARETTRRVASFRPDVVHVHTPFPLRCSGRRNAQGCPPWSPCTASASPASPRPATGTATSARTVWDVG